MISVPKHFHSPQGMGMSRDHMKTRSSCEDKMSPSLQASLPGLLRSARTGHRCPLPTEAILGFAPGPTDSVNTVVALQRSLLSPGLCCLLSLTHSALLLWSLHLWRYSEVPGQGAGQPALSDPACAGQLDQMTSRGPCQPQQSSDFVKLSLLSHTKVAKLTGKLLAPRANL